MIPGALGCSVARPYYNRGSTGPPPINYTPLVTGGQTAGLPINTLSLGAVTVAAGETLFAGLCVDYTIGLLVSLDVGGAGLTAAQVGTSYGSPSLRLIRFYITAAQAPYSGNLVFDFTGGSVQPVSAAALASKVSGLTPTFPLDRSRNASGGPATTQDSLLTAATSQASEFIYGLIGTQGAQGDTVGGWQAGMVAGQHFEPGIFVGPCIKEGWQVVNAIGTYGAKVTGATSRRYGARCDTWKGL